MDNNLANQPKPDPKNYGFVPATTPEDQTGNWTIEGGEQKYYDDLIAWEEAQEEAAFQKTMSENEADEMGSDRAQ